MANYIIALRIDNPESTAHDNLWTQLGNMGARQEWPGLWLLTNQQSGQAATIQTALLPNLSSEDKSAVYAFIDAARRRDPK